MGNQNHVNKGGRPKTEISEKQIQDVVSMIQGGSTQKDIAKHLGVSLNTLKKYCKEHIGSATAMRHGFVVGKLMTLIKAGNVPATLFYLKTRCGWREQDINSTPEHVIRVAPVIAPHEIGTPEEWERLTQILETKERLKSLEQKIADLEDQ